MRVLAIDDQPEALKQIEKALRSAKGPDGEPVEVVAEADHRAGLALLDKQRFDIVITDMLMGPDADEGLEILRQLMDKSPVTIVLTAHPNIPNCVTAMRAGAWDYIEKVPQDESDAYENLLKSIRDAYAFRRRHPEASRASGDTRWIHENMDKLMKEYPGQVVAVLDQRVVDNDESFGVLAKRLKEKYPLAKPAIISIPDTRVDAIE